MSGKVGHKYLRTIFSEEVESTDVRCLFSEERARVGINHCLKVLAYIFRLGKVERQAHSRYYSWIEI